MVKLVIQLAFIYLDKMEFELFLKKKKDGI